ncbi:MAG TPA: DNA-binding response regulator [Verrucomicrobia bacterium]|nr:DNA-binding response regulator [Verrucomicrobiota bacterium]
MKTEKIAIIEDEADIRRIIVLALKTAGYRNIVEADTGDGGLALVRLARPDLVLLDLMLPGMDGVSVCRRLRDDPDTHAIPVIMLTAKTAERDIVSGLDAGAVDYVTKPFSKDVLLARIRAALRRNEEARTETLSFDGLEMNDATHTVALKGTPVELTLSEYRILDLLVRNRARVYTRSHIIDRISDGQKIVTERTVDVQMVNLRRKLGEWSGHIETVRGVGYRVV